MKKVYIKRLTKLAQHLGSDHLIEVLVHSTKEYKAERTTNSVEHFAWALDELPHLFRQWEHNDDSVPVLKSSDSLSPLAAAGLFFGGLTADEVFHLFVPGYQVPDYCGKDLAVNSNPGDLSHNIYQFILFKLQS